MPSQTLDQPFAPNVQPLLTQQEKGANVPSLTKDVNAKNFFFLLIELSDDLVQSRKLMELFQFFWFFVSFGFQEVMVISFEKIEGQFKSTLFVSASTVESRFLRQEPREEKKISS